MAYFLGLDSGGTKTECWLGDETEVLARAVCATVKPTRVAEEIACTRLRGLLSEVERLSGVALGAVTRSCVGMSGYTIASVREWMRARVSEQVGGELVLCGDEEIALDGAFRGGAGILVIGGTGSIVVGRCADGRRFTAGGWGPAVGDEGSGYWIGAEAVRAAFKALDRGVRTGLVEAIQACWGVEDVGAVVGVANSRPGPDFAALAPVVWRVAETGDEIARGLLERAGEALGEQVAAVWGKMRDCGEQSVPVAYTGGVLQGMALVREAMARRVEQDGIRVLEDAVNSMEGAMWRARNGGGEVERTLFAAAGRGL